VCLPSTPTCRPDHRTPHFHWPSDTGCLALHLRSTGRITYWQPCSPMGTLRRVAPHRSSEVYGSRRARVPTTTPGPHLRCRI